MEFKVKEVSTEDSKSKQEIEADLLKQHADQAAAAAGEGAAAAAKKEGEIVAPELNNENVLSYLKDKYKVEADSIDSILKSKEDKGEPDLPDDVKEYLKYREETNGRGMSDFISAHVNVDDLSDDQLLRRYYQSEDGLDSDDINFLIDKLAPDEDADADEVREKSIERKKELAKAKQKLKGFSEKYKAPLESGPRQNTESDDPDYKAYKEYKSKETETQQSNQKRFEYFTDETKKLFSDKFEGFEFNVGEEKMVFKPGDAAQLTKAQSDINTFVSKYVDKETGLINDPSGYHKALSAAMNADKLAEHFYNKGVADTVKGVAKKSKNFSQGTRSVSGSLQRDSSTVKSVSPPSRTGLKMK